MDGGVFRAAQGRKIQFLLCVVQLFCWVSPESEPGRKQTNKLVPKCLNTRANSLNHRVNVVSGESEVVQRC